MDNTPAPGDPAPAEPTPVEPAPAEPTRSRLRSDSEHRPSRPDAEPAPAGSVEPTPVEPAPPQPSPPPTLSHRSPRSVPSAAVPSAAVRSGAGRAAVRSAAVCPASRRSAAVRSAAVRSAAVRSAAVRSAAVRSAAVRSAAVRSAAVRSAAVRSGLRRVPSSAERHRHSAGDEPTVGHPVHRHLRSVHHGHPAHRGAHGAWDRDVRGAALGLDPHPAHGSSPRHPGRMGQGDDPPGHPRRGICLLPVPGWIPATRAGRSEPARADHQPGRPIDEPVMGHPPLRVHGPRHRRPPALDRPWDTSLPVGYLGELILWIPILVTGKYPSWAMSLYSGLLRYGARVGAYLLLLPIPYPPFSLS